MAGVGRGVLRPGQGSKQSVFVITLFVIIVILGANYWSLSSKYHRLIAEIERLHKNYKACVENTKSSAKSLSDKDEELQEAFRRANDGDACKSNLENCWKNWTEITNRMQANLDDCFTEHKLIKNDAEKDHAEVCQTVVLEETDKLRKECEEEKYEAIEKTKEVCQNAVPDQQNQYQSLDQSSKQTNQSTSQTARLLHQHQQHQQHQQQHQQQLQHQQHLQQQDEEQQRAQQYKPNEMQQRQQQQREIELLEEQQSLLKLQQDNRLQQLDNGILQQQKENVLRQQQDNSMQDQGEQQPHAMQPQQEGQSQNAYQQATNIVINAPQVLMNSKLQARDKVPVQRRSNEQRAKVGVQAVFRKRQRRFDEKEKASKKTPSDSNLPAHAEGEEMLASSIKPPDYQPEVGENQGRKRIPAAAAAAAPTSPAAILGAGADRRVSVVRKDGTLHNGIHLDERRRDAAHGSKPIIANKAGLVGLLPEDVDNGREDRGAYLNDENNDEQHDGK